MKLFTVLILITFSITRSETSPRSLQCHDYFAQHAEANVPELARFSHEKKLEIFNLISRVREYQSRRDNELKYMLGYIHERLKWVVREPHRSNSDSEKLAFIRASFIAQKKILSEIINSELEAVKNVEKVLPFLPESKTRDYFGRLPQIFRGQAASLPGLLEKSLLNSFREIGSENESFDFALRRFLRGSDVAPPKNLSEKLLKAVGENPEKTLEAFRPDF